MNLYFKSLGSVNFANLFDVSVGVVPFLNNSVERRLLGVASLASSNGSVNNSISADTTDVGFSHVEPDFNIFEPSILLNALLCEEPSLCVK